MNVMSRRSTLLLSALLALAPAMFSTVAFARSAPPASTQPDVPDTLDLATAIRFALDNNFDIRQARERIREQEGVLIEVRARQLPNVAASAGYQRQDRDISQSFPQSDRAWLIEVLASQVLYAGGGVRASVRSSQLVREAAVLEMQSVINNALLAVRTQFYNVLLAREQITVQEQNIELLKQQLKQAADRFEVGSTSNFEKLRAQVALANGQVPLITARNDYRIAIEQLRQALGYTNSSPGNVHKQPKILGTLDFVPVSYQLEDALSSARTKRPEIERLAKLSEAGESGVTAQKSGYYPNLSLVGGYQLFKGSTNQFRDSSDGFLVGLQSQWNIFDGRATTGRVAQARSQLEQTRIAESQQMLAIEVEVRQAHSSLQEATELAQATQQTVGQAEESVRLATARYQSGTATQLDVLQSQVDLTQARTNLVQTYYTYNLAVANLRKAMGQGDEFVTP